MPIIALYLLWYCQELCQKCDHHTLNFPERTLSFNRRWMLHTYKQWMNTSKCIHRVTLHSDLPRPVLIYAFCLNILSGLCTLTVNNVPIWTNKLYDHPFHKPQWDEKQNSQLSFNCSNTAEEVTLIISL